MVAKDAAEQAEMHTQSGPMKARPASSLYAGWVKEMGGDICGQQRASEDADAAVLRLESACLYLDARRPQSASGALGDTLWRDLSGAKHAV